MPPLEFMQRLAALVPRSRLHLIRFHGVLAPHAGLRPRSCRARRRNPAMMQPTTRMKHRRAWAGRGCSSAFSKLISSIAQCGDDFKIIAAIEEPAMIVKILTHLGLPARAPPLSPARPLSLFQAA